MTRIAIVLAAAFVAALVATGTAPAKEISALQICGAGGCKTVTDRSVLQQFEASGENFGYIGPAAPAAYYSVRVTLDAGNGEKVSWSAFYVPSVGAMREVDRGVAVWTRQPSDRRKLLDRAAGDLEPFAVPDVTRATVGGKRAADPDSYLGLYRLKTTRTWRFPEKRDWKRIRLYASTPSPWTDRAAELKISPTVRTLGRDGEYLRLSKAVARAVRTAAPVRLPAGSAR